MTILSNVTIVGASGNIGEPVLAALLADPSLSVTILARPGSKILSHPPERASVKTADFSNHEALVSALRGADALVLTLVVDASTMGTQQTLIAAAVEAGVKRVIPSEFGSNLDNQRVRELSVFTEKVKVRKVLEGLASEGKISWTAVSNGGFFDWGLKVGFLDQDAKSKKATLYDGGDLPISFTLLSDVAKAVAGILKHPEETKNRLVYVQSTRLSLKQLSAIQEKVLGIKFDTTVVSTQDVLKEANEKIAKGDPSGFFMQLLPSVVGKDCGGDYEGKDSNELLGIKLLDETEIEEVIKKNVHL